MKFVDALLVMHKRLRKQTPLELAYLRFGFTKNICEYIEYPRKVKDTNMRGARDKTN